MLPERKKCLQQMVNKIVEDINKALDADAYLAALALALMLPDICSKAEYGDVKNRYIIWYDEYIGDYDKVGRIEGEEGLPWLSGEVVYSLRCNFLHQGTPNIDTCRIKEESNKIDHFVLIIQKKNRFDLYASLSDVSKNNYNNKITRDYKINIRQFCLVICNVAKNYYKNNRDKFDFINYTIIDWDKEQMNRGKL